jgi:5-formyltetrahydrofolate cyclo-ligase
MTIEQGADLERWRSETRAGLLAVRRALPGAARQQIATTIARTLCDTVVPLPGDCIGFYWPIRGEFDLRDAMLAFMARGATAALPVVVGKNQPLEFRPWQRDTALVRGVWDIPVPAPGAVVNPTVLVIPLVGFDPHGHRLGYGGGYYDRTLATMIPRPLTIGVGLAASRLPTIHPQPYDIPLDAILTEQGWAVPLPADEPRLHITRAGPAPEGARTSGTTSPPCAAASADAAYMGWLSRGELLTLLNQLLEAERAGARGVRTLAQRAPAGRRQTLLRAVADDEARFCGMLRRHILALGGSPSAATGAFLDKLLAIEDAAAQLVFLNRGQGWVVRQLEQALPRIADAELIADLREMLSCHEQNIARCSEQT